MEKESQKLRYVCWTRIRMLVGAWRPSWSAWVAFLRPEYTPYYNYFRILSFLRKKQQKHEQKFEIELTAKHAWGVEGVNSQAMLIWQSVQRRTLIRKIKLGCKMALSSDSTAWPWFKATFIYVKCLGIRRSKSQVHVNVFFPPAHLRMPPHENLGRGKTILHRDNIVNFE